MASLFGIIGVHIIFYCGKVNYSLCRKVSHNRSNYSGDALVYVTRCEKRDSAHNTGDRNQKLAAGEFFFKILQINFILCLMIWSLALKKLRK